MFALVAVEMHNVWAAYAQATVFHEDRNDYERIIQFGSLDSCSYGLC
jgi:hypothetical protein